MRRILPAQVVGFIDSTLPPAIKEQSENPQKVGAIDLSPASWAAPLQTVLLLVSEVPPHLINVDESDYFKFLTAVEAIRSVLANWENTGNKHLSLERVPGLDKTLNPVTIIRQILDKCPDDVPSPQSHQLAFIPDANFRGNLQSDSASIERALNESEWKTATVLAGSVIEAVLLWALDQKDQKAGAGTCTAAARAQKLKLRGANPVDWDLHCYIAVAEAFKIIQPDTATKAALAKDFRNLIHPGKSVREQQECDRGTARMAVGALDHVVRDVERWNAGGQP